MIHINFEDIFNYEFISKYKNFVLCGEEWNGENYKFNISDSNIEFDKSGDKTLYEVIEWIKENHNEKTVRNFFEFVYENIETIFIGSFDNIRELAQNFNELSKNKEVERICKEIFNYGKLYNKREYPRFIQSILNVFYKKIKVCPYCNRQYIDVFNGTERTFDFEHHFHKSKYWIFSISLANLLPSCKSCNQRKGTIDVLSEIFLSPYEDVRVSFSIEYDEKEIGNTNSLNAIESSIKKIIVEQDRGSNVEKLYLEELYQLHKDIVAEIEFKKRAYPKIRRIFDEKTFDSLEFEEIYRLIYSNYYPISEEEFLKRPLSKLTFDIYEELNNPY
ncbi:HNH endonuclease [Persephonella sp.]